jgi:hypothetical protein
MECKSQMFFLQNLLENIWQSPFEIKHFFLILELRFFKMHETFFEFSSTICMNSVVLQFSQKKLFVGFIPISKIP